MKASVIAGIAFLVGCWVMWFATPTPPPFQMVHGAWVYHRGYDVVVIGPHEEPYAVDPMLYDIAVEYFPDGQE